MRHVVRFRAESFEVAIGYFESRSKKIFYTRLYIEFTSTCAIFAIVGISHSRVFFGVATTSDDLRFEIIIHLYHLINTYQNIGAQNCR